ncbi:MAG TPA: pyridoxamine 5'-phosphate oxidase family protein [Acidimicrobiales bacterium]|nr:pyridoxamine 5'-phosphate oxidase family protein [Acidimicrobiales bacterium]
MSSTPASPSDDLGPGPRTRVRRLPERAKYDRATVEAVLDEGFVCHLGFCSDGQPVVIPTGYARVGDIIYVHGAPANHALRSSVEGGTVCLTVTLVDGLVLARSAFHHSFNYRSVVVFGVAHEVEDADEKRVALAAFVDHVVPGRNPDTRPPTDSELRATTVVRIEIEEASAKVRTGGPKDEPEDFALHEIWAGEVPLQVVAGVPVADDSAPVTAPVPRYLAPYRRPGSRP